METVIWDGGAMLIGRSLNLTSNCSRNVRNFKFGNFLCLSQLFCLNFSLQDVLVLQELLSRDHTKVTTLQIRRPAHHRDDYVLLPVLLLRQVSRLPEKVFAVDWKIFENLLAGQASWKLCENEGKFSGFWWVDWAFLWWNFQWTFFTILCRRYDRYIGRRWVIGYWKLHNFP